MKPDPRLSIGVVCLLAVIWGLFGTLASGHRELFHTLCLEDGLVENTTALFFAFAGVAFLVAAFRSGFLRQRHSIWTYFFTFSWAALMLIFI